MFECSHELKTGQRTVVQVVYMYVYVGTYVLYTASTFNGNSVEIEPRGLRLRTIYRSSGQRLAPNALYLAAFRTSQTE